MKMSVVETTPIDNTHRANRPRLSTVSSMATSVTAAARNCPLPNTHSVPTPNRVRLSVEHCLDASYAGSKPALYADMLSDVATVVCTSDIHDQRAPHKVSPGQRC